MAAAAWSAIPPRDAQTHMPGNHAWSTGPSREHTCGAVHTMQTARPGDTQLSHSLFATAQM